MRKTKRYKQLSKEERSLIEVLLDRGCSIREISKVLGRSPSTISREIERNKLKKGIQKGSYETKRAIQKTRMRRRNAGYQGKEISSNRELKEYVAEKMKLGWSPEVISGRMSLEGQPFQVSKNTIYRYLYSFHGQHLCRYLPSKRYDKRKRRKKKTERTMIPHRVGIQDRPIEADLRAECGHLEGDTIVSPRKTHSKTALSVLYDRKSRYVMIRRIDSLKPLENNRAIESMLEELDRTKSLTLDNGIENKKHKQLEIPCFFCNPYSSWEKGGVENVNKMIRRYIPKKEDISNYSDEYIQKICTHLNNIPRRSLEYKTPLEVMLENGMISQKETKTPLRGVRLQEIQV